MGTFKTVLRFAAVTALTTTLSWAAHAAVLPPSQQLPAEQVSEFKNAPALLLQQYPKGGAKFISLVRDLAATDPTTLPLLIALLTNSDTTKEQQTAILAGLAQVARLAQKSDPNYATEIQQSVAATNNSNLSAAYQAATGDVALGIGGAGGGGGGGGGSGTGGATGNTGIASGGSNSGATTFGGLHYSNPGSSFTSGSVGSTSSSAVSRTR